VTPLNKNLVDVFISIFFIKITKTRNTNSIQVCTKDIVLSWMAGHMIF